MKIEILKLKDTDDVWSDEMYFTIKGLRDAVINNFYDNWDSSPITKQEIIGSKVVSFITKQILSTNGKTIEVDISFYHPNDDETKKVYDIEGMTDEFNYKLKQVIKNN